MHDGVVIIGQTASVHQFSAPAVGVVCTWGLVGAGADLQVSYVLDSPGIFVKLERTATILEKNTFLYPTIKSTNLDVVPSHLNIVIFIRSFLFMLKTKRVENLMYDHILPQTSRSQTHLQAAKS